MYAFAPCTCLVPSEARRGYQIARTVVIDCGKLSYGFWVSSLALLQVQPVLLTLNHFPDTFYSKMFMMSILISVCNEHIKV